MQSAVFRMLGISDEEAREKFGFLLDALQVGCPPHGGIALGMDRLVMLMVGGAQHPRSHRLPQNPDSLGSAHRRARGCQRCGA